MCGHQPGGGVLPLDPLLLSLSVPDVSRFCPVQGRVQQGKEQKDFPAHSKSTERMFGRGRQSANPRITGGLVSHEQGKRSATGLLVSPRIAQRAADGQ